MAEIICIEKTATIHTEATQDDEQRDRESRMRSSVPR